MNVILSHKCNFIINRDLFFGGFLCEIIVRTYESKPMTKDINFSKMFSHKHSANGK